MTSADLELPMRRRIGHEAWATAIGIAALGEWAARCHQRREREACIRALAEGRRCHPGHFLTRFGLDVWATCLGIVAMGEWAVRCDEWHQRLYGPRDPAKPSCNQHDDCEGFDRDILEMTGRPGSHCYKPGCRVCG